MRQYEALSCMDTVPLHIHMYRTLPYDWWFLEQQKEILKKFSQLQRIDGSIPEFLSSI